jgi:hypothetical protein
MRYGHGYFQGVNCASGGTLSGVGRAARYGEYPGDMMVTSDEDEGEGEGVSGQRQAGRVPE